MLLSRTAQSPDWRSSTRLPSQEANDLNVIALQVLNAFNAQIGGVSTGVPTIQAPNIGGLTEAGNTAGASAQAAATPGQQGASTQPSVIIVEVIGFGGGDGEPESEEEKRRRRNQSQMQDPNGRVQVLDAGDISDARRRQLVEEKRRQVARQ